MTNLQKVGNLGIVQYNYFKALRDTDRVQVKFQN